MPIAFKTDPPDPHEYFTLFETTGWNSEYLATAEELDRANRQSWFVVAAYDEGQLVGFGRVVSDTVLHAMIYDMIVRPDYQRIGLGSQVLSRLIDRCRAANIRDIQLFCAKGKEAFYRAHGFCPRPEDAPGMQFGNP